MDNFHIREGSRSGGALKLSENETTVTMMMSIMPHLKNISSKEAALLNWPTLKLSCRYLKKDIAMFETRWSVYVCII